MLLRRPLLALAFLLACHASAAGPGGPPRPRADVEVDPTTAITPIATAIEDRNHDTVPDRKGDFVRVRGIVTIAPAALGESFFQTVIQDSSGGIMLYSRELSLPLAEGDLVEAYGTIRQFRGMVQLQDLRVQRIGPGKLPTPINLSIKEANGWQYIGRRVSLDGVAGELSLDSFGQLLLTGDDGTRITLYVPPSVIGNFDWKQYSRGSRLRATGGLSIRKKTLPYDSGFQLIVASPRDLIVIGAPVPAWQAWALWGAGAAALLLALTLALFHFAQRRQKAREREIATLAALSSAFASGNLTQAQLARHACDVLTAFAVVEAALVHVFDGRGCLRPLAVSASNPEVGKVLNFADPLPAGDTMGDAHRHQIEARVAQHGLALLGVHPLTALSGTQGFLVALGPHRRRPSAMQERTLHSGVKLLAMALELRRNQERATAEQNELQQLVITDELTRLYNRRFLHEYLRVQVPLAQRQSIGLAFLAIDIDHFKAVNDTYGHDVGDRVLAGVAAQLREASRSSDLPVRMGGEEFLVAIAERDTDAACAVAERLRTAVAECVFDNAVPGQSIRVTVSVGVAVFGVHGHTIETVLRAADDAMYASKRGGRNRVTVAVPGEVSEA